MYLLLSEPEDDAESPEREELEGPDQSLDSELKLFSESELVQRLMEVCLYGL